MDTAVSKQCINAVIKRKTNPFTCSPFSKCSWCVCVCVFGSGHHWQPIKHLHSLNDACGHSEDQKQYQKTGMTAAVHRVYKRWLLQHILDINFIQAFLLTPMVQSTSDYLFMFFPGIFSTLMSSKKMQILCVFCTSTTFFSHESEFSFLLQIVMIDPKEQIPHEIMLKVSLNLLMWWHRHIKGYIFYYSWFRDLVMSDMHFNLPHDYHMRYCDTAACRRCEIMYLWHVFWSVQLYQYPVLLCPDDLAILDYKTLSNIILEYFL